MESEGSISIASLSRNCWKLVATKGFLTLSVVFVPGVDPLMYFEGGNHGKKFSGHCDAVGPLVLGQGRAVPGVLILLTGIETLL